MTERDVRLRCHLPRSQSVFMDRSTLLNHRQHWATEPAQASGPLDLLDPAESALYADLISGTYGPSVRLEQERISFSAVE